MTAQLRIDWTRCDGHGLCAALLPRHIGRDEWGYPVLSADSHTPIGNDAEADARRATLACPALALHLTRDT